MQQTQGIEIRWASNRLPVTVLLDDPTPARNPAWYEFPEQGNVAVVPNAFTERFADLMQKQGAAGKFSVVPWPGAQGRIDQAVPGVSQEELDGFVRIVGERIAPRWDISPELLTHNRAIDLQTMQPLQEREDVWGARQDEETLTKYIELSLQILRNVGLEPNGVTSPWQFGIEVEDAYRNAITTALRRVCGIRMGWYFLHLDPDSPYVPPRVVHIAPQERTSLTSLITTSSEVKQGHYDFAWPTQHGRPAVVDLLLTVDGRSGRLADLFAAGSPMAFHTHWQSLFSNGTGAGLDALADVCDRINRCFGDRIRWTSARELAVYAPAREATQIVMNDDGRRVRFQAPFPCVDFTVVIPMPSEMTSLSLDSRRLERLEEGDEPLAEGTWRPTNGKAIICVPLQDGMELVWR